MSKPSKSLLVLVCVIFLASGIAFSQSTINGKISGADGTPLPGATALIVGTNNYAAADADGRFTLKASVGDLIQFSFIGYQDFQQVLGNETELNITLVEGTMMLDEVVVVGYGVSLRKDITGAVASVTKDEFNKGDISNPLQHIQGKVAGVVVVQPGGDPNGDLTVRIRGATSLEGQPPLLVIDGVAIDDFYKYINSLNPADVESYDVLKDASAAAIYGSRGANGVLLVTTKKGRTGKTNLDYQGYSSIETIASELDLLSADQWREATAEMNLGTFDKGADMNWQDAITQTGYLHSHTIGISGGNDQLNYRGSVGYLKQQGVVINTGKEVITSRLTVNQKSFKNKLEVRYSINASVINRDFLPTQSSTSQARTGGAQIFDFTMKYLPVWPAYNADGSYFLAPNTSPNPLFLLNELYTHQREFFFQSSAKADYEILKGLKLGVLGALSTGGDTHDRFWPPLPGTNGSPTASKASNNKQILTGDLHGNYKKSFGKHSIDITGVYEYNNFINDGFSVNAEGFLVPELLNNNLGTATNVQTNGISSYKNEVRLISFLGRAVYNYDDRYIVTANFRRDGSSKFGPNNQWGNFPSFSIAWRASNESFLQTATWLNLKMRVSYGYTGNQENLDPYKYQILYEPSGPYLYNGQFLQSYAVTQENNPDLKWEVRQSFNIGLDFSLWTDRLYGTFDVFNDKTNDLLFEYGIPQPPFLTNQVLANAASAVNKGMEFTLGGTIVKNQLFTWNAVGNVGTLTNYITELLGTFKGTPLTLNNRSYGFVTGGALGNYPATMLEEGYPAGVFFLAQHGGLDAAGKELFNNYDLEGNFVGTSSNVNAQDFFYIDPTPDFTWGLTNNFMYRNFDLSFFFRGVQGQKIFANSLYRMESIKYLQAGQNVTDRGLTNGFSELPYPTTFWLKDGSFARLENITLGYELKNLKGIQSLRVYATANNLFVITSYEGIDPEIRTEGKQRYIDLNYYPKTKGFTIGVNVAF